MPIEVDRTSTLSYDSPFLALVRQTKRYSICEVEPGMFEVIDQRYLLDQLLGIPELRPTSNDWVQIEFDEALEALSSGPTLTLDDIGMLAWLEVTTDILDPEGKNSAFNAPYRSAVVLKGTFEQVEHFIRAALDHRVR
jgi:hypothetical protein